MENDSVELKFAGNIRRLRLQPGDKIVIEADDRFSREQIAEVGIGLKQKFPDNDIVILVNARVAAVVSTPKVPVAFPGLTNGISTLR